MLRLLLLVLAVNIAVLAIFGTLQKLSGATALYFGLRTTPQTYFFASFIYHNHWGAFALLMMGALIGLLFHSARRSHHRDIWHSPVLAGVVAVVFVSLTLPLSGSRSSTVLGFVLLSAAFLHGLIRVLRARRAAGRSVILPLTLAFGFAGAASLFTYQIAEPTISGRLATTRLQWSDMRAKSDMMPRGVLYRDTWHLARERLTFGWGMGSYPVAFFTYNTQHHSPVDGLPHYFLDAHSDWLQSVAEVGVIGTLLLGLCGAAPLWPVIRACRDGAVSGYLLGGCTLVLLYAALEFPFGNRAVVVAFWVCWFVAIQYARLNARSDQPGRRLAPQVRPASGVTDS